MVVLANPLLSTNTESQTIDVFQTNIVSGTGPFNNPLDIYHPGHKVYLDKLYGENKQINISGIVKNIDLLRVGSEIKLLQPMDAIRVFDPRLLLDYKLAPEYNGISVNLKFNGYNVITEDNIFKNL